MIRLVAITCLLAASASSFSVDGRRNCAEAGGGGGDVKGPTSRPATAPVTTDFPCKQDWNKTCTADSDCCSGVCLKPFCKILGINETVKPKQKSGVKGKKSNTKNKVLKSKKIA